MLSFFQLERMRLGWEGEFANIRSVCKHKKCLQVTSGCHDCSAVLSQGLLHLDLNHVPPKSRKSRNEWV